jgi:hypothetical protein
MKTGKSGPRPLPTLTQVVKPLALPLVQDNNTLPRTDAILERLMPIVEGKLRALLEQVLREQKSTLESCVRSELEVILSEVRASAGSHSDGA